MYTFQALFLVFITLLLLPKTPWRQIRRLYLAWRGGDRAEEEDFLDFKPTARGPLLTRIYIGLLLGWSAHWFALEATTLDFRDLPHAEMQVQYDHYNRDKLMCQRTRSWTMVVAGFPFFGVEGHGGGGYPDYLPVERGLYILLANLACFLLAGVVGTQFVSRARVTPVLWLTFVVAVFGTMTGGYWCVYYWD